MAALAVAATGCLKDKSCKPKSPTSEAADIEAYATLKSIAAVRHSTGLYYEIIDPGTAGTSPNVNSKIVITYRGEFLDGRLLDEMTTPNTSNPWELSSLIEGWRVGLQLIGKGGHIKLIVPSSMAYGCIGTYGVPPDAVLYFDVHLYDVQ